MSFFTKLFDSGRAKSLAKMLDAGSKLYVSLTDAQKAQLLALLTPEQMMMGLEFYAEWEKFKDD